MLAALLEAAGDAHAPWRCAALDAPALPAEALTLGAATWTVSGHTLERTGADDEVVIGVVADAAGSAPGTIAALGRLRAAFERAHVDVVLTLGGMGRSATELEATLGTLAERATWPTVALPGDLEGMTDQVAAIAALRERGATVLDGRLVRWIELPGATVGTLPGAGSSLRLVAGDDGCVWRAADISKVYTELTARKGVRIVASAEAPRAIIDGEPTGELALNPPQPVEVALHGPAAPAPSRAATGGRDGKKVSLTPGTADATPRLPDPHASSAGLLVVRRASWSWKPLVELDHQR